MSASAAIGRQLDRIERIAEEQAREIDAANFQKYAGLFKIAADYFKTRNVLMYGGTAINELLPAAHKFYDPNTLPDIDVFTPMDKMNAVADGLIRRLETRGFTLAAAKPALHENTLKVFVEGVPIADISGVSPRTFRILKKDSRIGGELGIRIVNPEFLKLSLHIQLSQPFDAHRWKKVFERAAAFYAAFPPPPSQRAPRVPAQAPEAGEFAAILREWFRGKPWIMCGFDALQLFAKAAGAGAGAAAVPAVPALGFHIISEEEPLKVGFLILKHLRESHPLGASHPTAFQISEAVPDDGLVPEHVRVSYKKTPIAVVYRAPACVSFAEVAGYRIASIHTMLRLYMGLALSGSGNGAAAAAVANALTWLHLRLVKSPSRRKILQEFLLQCYGFQEGVFTMRRNLLERMAARQVA